MPQTVVVSPLRSDPSAAIQGVECWVQLRLAELPHGSPPVCALPVNPPTSTRHWSPEQLLARRSFRVMVERSGALEEASRMPRVSEPAQMEIEVMAELVTKRVQERPERIHLFADCRPHP
jgi:hypothetical protein